MTPRTRGELFLLATTVIWGSTFVAVKIGLRDMSAMMLIAIRFAAAALFFLALFSKRIFPVESRELTRGAVLGILLFLGFAAQTVGLNYTTASKSAFITSLMVVFAPLLQVLIERRPPTRGNVAGVIIVCSGLWFLTSPEKGSFNFGDALTLFCAMIFGLYIVYLDISSKVVPVVRLTFLQIATCAFLSWGIILLFEPVQMVASTASVTSLVYLTIFATIITTLVQTRFQKETTPTRAVIIFSIEPVFAALLAFLLLNEIIGSVGLLGGALIILGILTSELSDGIPVLKETVAFRRRDE